MPTAGTYFLGHWTNNTQRDGKVFHALDWSGGASGAGQWFSVASNTEFVWLFPAQNDDPIQVAAITGQILHQDAVTPHGLGIPVHDFRIKTDTGCPHFPPYTDSCFVPPHFDGGPTGTTLIGITEIDGVPTAHWKYITAHELGHHVQFAALGTLAGYYDQNASEAHCKCDYDLSWGNTEHCLQSREHGTGAQVEGFAQMFASRVFNNPSQGDARFVYYKPIAWDGDWFDPSLPPSPVDVLDQYRWRDTHCAAVGKGVELDWMAFYYALTMEYSSDSVPMSDLTGLYRHTCGDGVPTTCQNVDTTWSLLNFWKNSFWANNSDAINYWTFLSNAHGVVN